MATQWIGVLSPPPGVESNFVDPDDQLDGNIALHTICLTLATAAVALRLFTRECVLRVALGIDDYFCIISWCLSVTFSGLMCTAYHWGIGRHMWDEPLSWLVPALKFFTIAQYIYLPMTATIKLTFLFFFYKIFKPHVIIRRLIIGGIVFVVVTHITLLFLTIFSCKPVSHAWNEFGEGKCWDPKILPYLSGALSSATDLFVLVIPIKPLWGLNMKLAGKIRLLAVFGVGVFACVASLVRLGRTHVLTESADATWNISQIGIWAVIECNVGIFCSCLMLLPKFLERYFPKRLFSSIAKLFSSRDQNSSRAQNKSSGGPKSQSIEQAVPWVPPKQWNHSFDNQESLEMRTTQTGHRTSEFV